MNVRPDISGEALSPLGAAALDYASRGYAVFPLAVGRKGPHPDLPERPKGEGGYKFATSDPAQIIEWWTEWPDANIGLRLDTSGLVAIDVDHYKPECEWETWVAGRELPDTLRQSTASGGDHFVFKANKLDKFRSPCKGVDIKHHGYIVVEPSVADGGQYRWETVREPAVAPDWLQPKQGEPGEPTGCGATRHEYPGEISDLWDKLPQDLRATIEHGKRGDRSADFQGCVNSLVNQGIHFYEALELFEAHPTGPAEKYITGNRLERELERSWLDAIKTRKRPERADHNRGQVLDLTRDEPLEPPDEIIRDTIPATGVGFLGGQSGALKTFTAVELSVCLATGEAFAGRKIEQPGGVLYCAFEGEGTIPWRVKGRRSLLDNPDTELPIRMLKGFGSLLTTEDYDDFEGCVLRVAADLEEQGAPISAVIVDTVLAAGMIAEDKENDPAAWQHIFDNLKPISEQIQAPIILVHHYGKSATAGLRGSSNARAAADFVLAMTCDRNEITGATHDHHLALTKSRTAPEGPIGMVTHRPVAVGERRDGSQITTLVLSFDAKTKKFMPEPKAKPERRCDVAFRSAFAMAHSGHGEGEWVGVLDVRTAFDEAYGPTGGEDEKKRRETLRKQFSNALRNLASQYECEVREGVEFIAERRNGAE